MKDKIIKIRLREFDGAGFRDVDLSRHSYVLVGLVAYQATAGQGDIEHRWVYLCKNANGQPVLISEVYDLSWWGQPDPGHVSRESLRELTEEALTPSVFERYRDMAQPVDMVRVHLPITPGLPNMHNER